MTGALSLLKLAGRNLAWILALGAPPALLLMACDDDTGPTPSDGGSDGSPATRVAPRGCQYLPTIHIEGLGYGPPFLTNEPQTPAGPIDVCMNMELDRTQLPFDWTSKSEGTVTGISRFASIPLFYDHPLRKQICSESPDNNFYCNTSEGYELGRAFGWDLNEQVFFVADLSIPSDLRGTSWGAIFEGVGVLTNPETQERGPVWSTIGFFEFLKADDPSAAAITLDFETTVEDELKPGTYLPPVDEFYGEFFSEVSGCLPVEGVPTGVVDPETLEELKIPSWEDGHGVILRQGLQCFLPNVRVKNIPGENSFETTCCEGAACEPVEGITLDRVLLRLEIPCEREKTITIKD